MTIKVFLLDDHEVVRKGLRDLVEAEADMTVVGESGSAQEAARRIPALRPDVAVFDARLPDGSGIDACRQVRSVDPSIRGLILTSYDDEEAISAALLAGASGYLLKNVNAAGILDAIRRVSEGEDLLDAQRAERLRTQWSDPAAEDPRLRSLTPTEHRILVHVAEGLTNRQIGELMSLAEKTVKNYVSSVLAKMGMERRTQAAVYAATHGLAREPRT